MEKVRPGRPLGVAILAVLEVIGGVLAIIGGVSLVALGAIVFKMIPVYGELIAAFGVLFAGFILLIGIFSVIVGWGFWRGSGWAWNLGVVLYVIGIILGVLPTLRGDASGMVGVIINGLILYYLFKPNVKAWFKFP